MKWMFYIFLVFSFWPLSVLAESRVEISAKDCRRLVKHTPSGDVVFKPGVDVRGNKVKGADLNAGSHILVPDIFSFTMDMDLSAYGISSLVSVGVVTFDVQSGKLSYNGSPLSGGAESELASKCRKVL